MTNEDIREEVCYRWAGQRIDQEPLKTIKEAIDEALEIKDKEIKQIIEKQKFKQPHDEWEKGINCGLDRIIELLEGEKE